MVAVILGFIFFTPRHVFRDLPPAAVETLQPGVYRVEAAALVRDAQDLDARIARVVREQTGREVRIQRREPVKDAGGTLLAYRVWVDK